MNKDDGVQEWSMINLLFAGAMAGLAVDLALFPIDTVKTRFQSEIGFWKSGGLRRIYTGIGPVAIGAAPGSALFFCTYEATKLALRPFKIYESVKHMGAASLGEIFACLVRVPIEVVKQRRQVLASHSSFSIISSILKREGALGLYRGYVTTIFREIPFSIIQFPLWEVMKTSMVGYDCTPWQSAICGAVAGGLAAAVTTPLDVAKTRLMLAPSDSLLIKMNMIAILRSVFEKSGIRGIFSGLVPRVVWTTFGGVIFFGTYEQTRYLCWIIIRI